MFVEFTDGQKAKLAVVEKSEALLERTCSDVRIAEIQAEIGELLPPTFRFVVWEVLCHLYKSRLMSWENVLCKSVCQ